MNLKVFFAQLIFFTAIILSCKHERPQPSPQQPGGYPEAIAKIVETRCAVSGCHNNASYQNAGGLLLDTWEHMFQGGNNGAVVIPYNSANSSLLYFINTHPEYGPVASPTMPLNETPLTEDEYLLIKNWIETGAADINGNIPFATDASTRQKIYLTMQGCDMVAVIDAQTKVVMRYIEVGKTPAIENPHCVRVSSDGRFAYVSFLGGDYIQKNKHRDGCCSG